MKIKYVGALDSKRVLDFTFRRLVPVEPPTHVLTHALKDELSFIVSDDPGDADVPPELLALREQYADAMDREADHIIRNATRLLNRAEEMEDDTDDLREKKRRSIENAQKEIDFGRNKKKEAEAWRAKVKAEKEAKELARLKAEKEIKEAEGKAKKEAKGEKVAA